MRLNKLELMARTKLIIIVLFCFSVSVLNVNAESPPNAFTKNILTKAKLEANKFKKNTTAGKTAPNNTSNRKPANSNTSASSSENNDGIVSIDFNNVDITVLIKFMSEITHKRYIVDNRVKGKITIISPNDAKTVNEEEAYKIFKSVLEVHGYTIVEAGEITKILPMTDARSKNITTRFEEDDSDPEDILVTQVIHLNYASPSDIKRSLASFISKNSVMVAYSPTNTLIITDILSNIQRILKIIKVIDVTDVGREISVFPLELADATKLVKLLGTIFKTTKKTSKSSNNKAQFVADERTNAIIILASKLDTERIRKLIKMLDKAVQKGKGKIHVYYLENATAEDLAKVLQAIPKRTNSRSKAIKKAPVVSGDVQITADKATNSLIIMADNDDYQTLEAIIKKLDIPRSMVYIECLIMEVDVARDFTFGTEWVIGDDTNIRGTNGAVGGGFSGSTNYGNLAGMAGANTSAPGVSILPSGFAMGVFAETLQIGDIVFPNLGAVIQAYKKDEDVHILSTPQIMTTDNEEATITVGKNVPYQTKATTTNNDTYNSYEYKDVGVTLKITPQISKDRRIRLKIFQEATRLIGGDTDNTRPTTMKKTIETTVIVNDNNTIVIGGLIDDSYSITEYKVPCLGDIPGLKWMFNSLGNTKEKTNLYVFLTPRVVNTAREAEVLYNNKKQSIDKVIEGSIKLYKNRKQDIK